ncbi:RusA family crossover junction endodeoxyribonuclease [Burkholderia gladioli]|uniref:RusA family crossover junction endodeoxyribonuclease n=1 Tax=Burkholderia gladioli TaxID=28095 RepID=UPI00163EFCDA|nr:RusA family crossover junction endodeoxyribonuclease [Burkholderia gladioli]
MIRPPYISVPGALRSVAFEVLGAPVAKGRPKFARRGARVTTYTPAKTESYEGHVKFKARLAMRGEPPYAGPVRLVIYIAVPIPASWSQKRQAEAAAGEIGATKKPDEDNVVKALKDAMNGIVYLDDSQVVSNHIEKFYAREPGVRIEATELNLKRA